jgi:hypothetical protein
MFYFEKRVVFLTLAKTSFERICLVGCLLGKTVSTHIAPPEVRRASRQDLPTTPHALYHCEHNQHNQHIISVALIGAFGKSRAMSRDRRQAMSAVRSEAMLEKLAMIMAWLSVGARLIEVVKQLDVFKGANLEASVKGLPALRGTSRQWGHQLDTIIRHSLIHAPWAESQHQSMCPVCSVYITL